MSRPARPRTRRSAVVGVEAADHRRAGARREGGVEEIDVEAEVALRAADPRADLRDGSLHAVLRAAARIEHAETVVRALKVRMPTWIERAGSTRPSRAAWKNMVPWSMRPSSSLQVSRVGVEVHQGERPVHGVQGLQDRVADEVVATQRQRRRRRARRSPRRRREWLPVLPAVGPHRSARRPSRSPARDRKDRSPRRRAGTRPAKRMRRGSPAARSGCPGDWWWPGRRARRRRRGPRLPGPSSSGGAGNSMRRNRSARRACRRRCRG